jgi:HSP20 family protein
MPTTSPSESPSGEPVMGESTTLIETADDPATTQRIPVNVYETDSAVVVVAPMPGVMPDDVQIAVEGRRMTIRAELRTDAPKNYLVHEWEYGAYERTVELPEGTSGPVTASLGNGQLAVSVRRQGDRAGERLLVQPGGPGADQHH